MVIFTMSPKQVANLLYQSGYVTDDSLATLVWMAMQLDRPLLVEGEAGVTFVHKLRKHDLEKNPGIAETLDWVRALYAMGQDRVPDDPEIIRACLSALLKTRSDRWQMEPEILSGLRTDNRVGIDVGVAGAFK